jgi:hypothetical protein
VSTHPPHTHTPGSDSDNNDKNVNVLFTCVRHLKCSSFITYIFYLKSQYDWYLQHGMMNMTYPIAKNIVRYIEANSYMKISIAYTMKTSSSLHAYTQTF